jgi:hypothetical protein
MDGHHMFSIYGTLIIIIIHRSYINLTYSFSYEKSTWYQSGTGLDSLTGGPRKMREIVVIRAVPLHDSCVRQIQKILVDV